MNIILFLITCYVSDYMVCVLSHDLCLLPFFILFITTYSAFVFKAGLDLFGLGSRSGLKT